MKIDIYQRVIDMANYTIENKSTVRKTAEVFNISKSTVYHNLTVDLPSYHTGLDSEVEKVLKLNKSERCIRGGMATKAKYENMKNNM